MNWTTRLDEKGRRMYVYGDYEVRVVGLYSTGRPRTWGVFRGSEKVVVDGRLVLASTVAYAKDQVLSLARCASMTRRVDLVAIRQRADDYASGKTVGLASYHIISEDVADLLLEVDRLNALLGVP